MIRIRPIGMALAILFLVFGPHGWFMASSGSTPVDAQSTPLSWVLPDASKESDRPTRGMVDAVQTKEGWKVRVASGRQLWIDLVIAAVLLAFAWPLRQMAAKRRNSADTAADEDS